MAIVEELLPEFEAEMAATRRVLERVPEAKTGFRPHPKSWTLGELGVHLANIPFWVGGVMRAPELDVAPPGGPQLPRPKFESAAATLKTFDANVANARALLAGATDAEMTAPWTLKNGGAVIFSRPRNTVLRSFILNHTIHHRGQMTVYLRLCDVALPAVYGATADEAM